ncbi:response regulator [bacterium]|nr:response regulator [bacterium]
MKNKILFVDDDPNILMAYSRNLRKLYDVDTAPGGAEGLAKLAGNGSYPVVVSDLRMPGMDGIEFLSKVRLELPDTVRIMLTGNADLEAAIESVNKGNIFRFLVKPCDPDTMKGVLDAGIRQYNLITAEREILEKTLKGSIKMLTDVLSLVNPVAFGRASRVKSTVAQMAKYLKLENPWHYEVAAMLSQVGCVAVPSSVLEKRYLEKALSDDETQMMASHPGIAHDIITNIPRLEIIAEIIANQEKNFDESDFSKVGSSGKEITLGARLLKVALDLDTLESGGFTKTAAIAEMEEYSERYDPEMLKALKETIREQKKYVLKSVTVGELTTGMILGQNVVNRDGLLLITKGQEVSNVMRERLKNYAMTVGVEEPIEVQAPDHFWA